MSNAQVIQSQELRESLCIERKAFFATDGDEKSCVVFAKNGAEARRFAANKMGCEFATVESCRRKAVFDQYADLGYVPVDALLDDGWWFECWGCGRRIDSDLKGEIEAYGRTRFVTLKPICVGKSAVYCCPSCKARDEKDKRICKEMEEAAIAAFKRRVLRRFPSAEFPKDDPERPFGKPHHAYARRENGVYGYRQIVVSFAFPGQKIAPATYRWDLDAEYSLIGPRAPQYWCCSGDKEAFEAYAEETARKIHTVSAESQRLDAPATTVAPKAFASHGANMEASNG